MVKWIVGVVVLVAVGLVGFLSYMGIFSAPVVTETQTGPYTYAYQEFVGDYKKTGPVFNNVNTIAVAAGIKNTQGIGVYFDDPSKVPAEKLRSNCGIVVGEADLSKLAAVADTLKTGRIEKKNSIVVVLPIKNPLSFMIGPMRAYPALMKYAQNKNIKSGIAYELYDMSTNVIQYVFQYE